MGPDNLAAARGAGRFQNLRPIDLLKTTRREFGDDQLSFVAEHQVPAVILDNEQRAEHRGILGEDLLVPPDKFILLDRHAAKLAFAVDAIDMTILDHRRRHQRIQ